MKTLTAIMLSTFILVEVSAHDKYLELMGKNIQAIYTAKTPEQYQEAINTFERIAAAEKTKWEPYYYCAFGWLMLANNEADISKKDAYADKAMEAVALGREINSTESELIAMEAFALMIKVKADPAKRGPELSPKAYQLLAQAIEKNPDNPRAIALLAQMQMGTARFLGMPMTEACANATKASEKFSSFKTDNPLAPTWGKTMTETLLKNCN